MDTTLTLGQIKALKRKYDRLEANNDHNEAALLLVMGFGTPDEEAIIDGIIKRMNQQGFIDSADSKLRFETANKYYIFFKHLTK